jgi:hypothetical protein
MRLPVIPVLFVCCILSLLPQEAPAVSIAREWNEECLDAIRIDRPRPPVHARNLFHLSAAMYDAWAAWDTAARGYFFTEKIAPTGDVAAYRSEAISYAAYRILSYRYKYSFNSNTTLAALSAKMATLGYPTNITNTVGTDASAIGNRIAALIIAFGVADGANETGNPSYRANNGYGAVNEPLIVAYPDIEMADPNRWQPLSLEFSLSQNGIPEPSNIQTFVCPHWGYVKPFALMRLATNDVYEDVGMPPLLGGATDAQFKDEMVQVIELSSLLDPANTNMIDISPGAIGNNPLGSNDGTGHPVNPATGLPYPPQPVRIGDYGRVIAEFWADGPESETPPGHWNVLANHVSDVTTNRRIGGTGPVVDELEWDVKMYLGLNGAEHDAAIAAWNHKGVHDSVRPISAIRFMGHAGQSSDTNLPSYNTNGLPLIPGLIELSGTNVMIYAWPGEPADPTNQVSGAQWVQAASWVPYQKKTFVTPPFAGFISGHSTYSRAGAEFMSRFTGSIYFPSGLYEFVAFSNDYLTFERGPSTDVRLQCATYYDAADQAGQSRLWGGIHIEADDFNGRRAGAKIGQAAYELAQQYYQGAPLPHPIFDMHLAADAGQVVCAWPAISGRQYVVESATSATGAYTWAGTYTASGMSVAVTGAPPADVLFYRVVTTNGL